MCVKLRPLVCGDWAYGMSVRELRADGGFCQRLRTFSLRQHLHQQLVGAFPVRVIMAPLPYLPTIVSISQSPKRVPSASDGLSWILTRPGIFFTLVVWPGCPCLLPSLRRNCFTHLNQSLLKLQFKKRLRYFVIELCIWLRMPTVSKYCFGLLNVESGAQSKFSIATAVAPLNF